MPTERKIAQVVDLEERLSRCSIAVATNPTGLDVNTLNDLRRRLREKGIEYRMVKNNLAHMAAGKAGVPQLTEVVQGPTALAFGYDNPAIVAAALEEYIRSTRSSMAIRGGLLGHRIISSAQVATLATLPPREQLVAQVMGQLQAPIAGLVGQLQAPLQRLVNALIGPVSQITLLLYQRLGQLRAQQREG